MKKSVVTWEKVFIPVCHFAPPCCCDSGEHTKSKKAFVYHGGIKVKPKKRVSPVKGDKEGSTRSF